MKVFRGPSTKPLNDDSHELVSNIEPESLEASIKNNCYIRFNISKDAVERQAVCTAHFEESDLIPMMNGLISKLQEQQTAYFKIQKIIRDMTLSDSEKIAELQEIIECRERVEKIYGAFSDVLGNV